MIYIIKERDSAEDEREFYSEDRGKQGVREENVRDLAYVIDGE